MRSVLAALRTLVLPYGQTSGQRIVLDGTTGRISVYDPSGVEIIALFPHQLSIFDTSHREIIRLDDVGLAVFNTAFQLLARLSAAGTEFFSTQAGESAQGRLDAFASGLPASPTRRAGMLLRSPAVNSNDIAEINLYSESFDATLRPEIHYGATSHFFEDAGLGNQADVFVNGKSLPRGIVGRARITATPATFTAEADVAGLSVTWTAIPGRYYKITCTGRGMTSTAIGNMRASITDSSNAHVAESDVRVETVNNIGGTVALQYTVPGTASGSVTYKIRAAVLTGGGTGTYAAISEMTVEDVGIP